MKFWKFSNFWLPTCNIGGFWGPHIGKRLAGGFQTGFMHVDMSLPILDMNVVMNLCYFLFYVTFHTINGADACTKFLGEELFSKHWKCAKLQIST